MVVNKEKQTVQKFVKWLYRNKIRLEKQITGYKSDREVTEEESLQLVDKFWNEV